MNIYDRNLSISGGTLHHIGLMLEASEKFFSTHRCAWCDAERGIKPDPTKKVSHGMCPRCHDRMKSEIGR